MPAVIRPARKDNRLLAGKRRTDPRRASPSPRIVHFRMQSRRSAIAPTVERVIDAVRGARLSADQIQDLAVAVAEALSNAAVHGHAHRPEARVRVDVTVTPGKRAVIDVKDSGAGFDFGALSDPTDPSHILLPGGRGVFLMRRLVDHMEFSECGSRVRLVMERHR